MKRRHLRECPLDASFLISASLTRLRPDLAAQINKWGLRDAGFAYNIVSVFGSQSTGKSKYDATIERRHLTLSMNSRYIVEQAIWYYIRRYGRN